LEKTNFSNDLKPIVPLFQSSIIPFSS